MNIWLFYNLGKFFYRILALYFKIFFFYVIKKHILGLIIELSETFAGPILLFLLVYVCDALFPCMFIICDSKHILPWNLICGNPLRTKSFEDWVEGRFFQRGSDLLLPGPAGHYHCKFNSCLEGFVDLIVFSAGLWFWILREYPHINTRTRWKVCLAVLWMQVIFPLLLHWGYNSWWNWFYSGDGAGNGFPLDLDNWAPLGYMSWLLNPLWPWKPKKNLTGFGKCP